MQKIMERSNDTELEHPIEYSLDSFIVTKIYDFDFFYNSFEDFLIPINLSW